MFGQKCFFLTKKFEYLFFGLNYSVVCPLQLNADLKAKQSLMRYIFSNFFSMGLFGSDPQQVLSCI